MNFFWVYLIQRFFLRAIEFFRHWYIKSFFITAHKAVDVFRSMDQFWALRITLRYFFQPLYGDYSIVGRVLGFIFRSGRVVVAVLLYAAVFSVFLTGYFIWLMIPPYIIFKIIG